MAGEMTPIQVMAMLNDLYTQFDELVDKYKVYKVETIGDAYMVLGGAPNVCPPPEGAEKVAMFALAAINTVRNFRKEDGTTVYIRCGIASGPVVAGVVGRAMPRYCLFGDTVNFASRMESTSSRMQIQIPELTYFLLRNAPNHRFKMNMRKGADGLAGVQVKGKGRVMTYWIEGVEDDDLLRAGSGSGGVMDDDPSVRGILEDPSLHRAPLNARRHSNEDMALLTTREEPAATAAKGNGRHRRLQDSSVPKPQTLNPKP
ncbi:adenylate and guanylate cyclase catalytic domain-containing protein [Baffinella frigidus]|nr:adenylate and guanylate cyclase catalytic domain-containing protein [Cryptophyta sp. CCMP2293]